MPPIAKSEGSPSFPNPNCSTSFGHRRYVLHPNYPGIFESDCLAWNKKAFICDNPAYMKLRYKNLKTGIRVILAAEAGTCLYEKAFKVHAFRFGQQLVMRSMNRVHKY